MSREGEARRPALLEPPKRSPRPSFLPTMSLSAAVCLACLPSAAAPQPRPLRCGLLSNRARRVKATQVDELKGGGALALALTAVLGLSSRTEAGQKKGSKGLDFGLYIMHVLAGNFDLYDFCHLHGQAGRRMRDLYFPRYHFDNATECEEFVGALRSLLEQVPLTVDVPDLLTHWRWFGEWSLGCIGVLSDWLVETVDALCKRGETTLTIDALQKHALPPDLRARMEREARTGEFKMEQAKAQSEQELKLLLGNPTPVPGTTLTTVRHTNGASPDPQQGTHGYTRVERAATRDLVGDQAQTTKTPKCTFSGVISIDIRRFLDSGIRLFECPDCARTRSLSPRNGVLRFPSHDKRKTHTPNTDQRWAMREATWEVVGG